eukprot:354569-Chlamydomonas_euryale.AAC.4
MTAATATKAAPSPNGQLLGSRHTGNGCVSTCRASIRRLQTLSPLPSPSPFQQPVRSPAGTRHNRFSTATAATPQRVRARASFQQGDPKAGCWCQPSHLHAQCACRNDDCPPPLSALPSFPSSCPPRSPHTSSSSPAPALPRRVVLLLLPSFAACLAGGRAVGVLATALTAGAQA